MDSDNNLIDRYRRHINYLRVSVTDRCNLHCVYCMPPNRVPKISHDQILRYEEILRIVGIGVKLGIRKVRVTGGEPLVRKGVVPFLQALSRFPEIRDVSLTTNGVLLEENLYRLREAGIRRLNVSLDTLRPERYRQITGHDNFKRVWEGIHRALEAGFRPVKVNVVALREINGDELVDLARLTLDTPLHVRFIEYMPMGGRAFAAAAAPLLVPEIRESIAGLGRLTPVSSGRLDGPARRYRLPGAVGEVGFISARSHHFCDTCNRLRLTASGGLRPCLLSDHQEDLKTALRSGCSDDTLAEIFLRAVRHKRSAHRLSGRPRARVDGQMRAIGG